MIAAALAPRRQRRSYEFQSRQIREQRRSRAILFGSQFDRECLNKANDRGLRRPVSAHIRHRIESTAPRQHKNSGTLCGLQVWKCVSGDEIGGKHVCIHRRDPFLAFDRVKRSDRSQNCRAMYNGIDGARPFAYLVEEIFDLSLLADIARRIEHSRKAGSNLGKSVATSRANKEIMAVARKRSGEGRSKARTRARDNDRLPIDHYYPRSFSISDPLPQKLMPQANAAKRYSFPRRWARKQFRRRFAR